MTFPCNHMFDVVLRKFGQKETHFGSTYPLYFEVDRGGCYGYEGDRCPINRDAED